MVSVFIYKGLDWKGVWKALEQCVDTLAIVLILISTSSIFGYCLTTLHVPDLAANAVRQVSDNPYVIALLLITFIPAISLCIPWAFGYTGGR